jgi:hypothetical protein
MILSIIFIIMISKHIRNNTNSFILTNYDIFDKIVITSSDILFDFKINSYAEHLIDCALYYDFIKTLNIAVYIRETYNVTLLPQYIISLAVNHRKLNTKYNKGYISHLYTKNLFNAIINCIKNSNDLILQFNLWQDIVHGKIKNNNNNKSKKIKLWKSRKRNLPNILKKAWRSKLEDTSFLNTCIFNNDDLSQIINMINIVHPRSYINPIIKNILKTKQKKIKLNIPLWQEVYHSLETISTCDNIETLLYIIKKNIIDKNYSFNYYYEQLDILSILKSSLINLFNTTTLIEQCLMTHINTLPKFNGKCVSLINNSYNEINIDSIIISLITGMQHDHIDIGIFNDNLSMIGINRKLNILDQINCIKSVASEEYCAKEIIKHNTNTGLLMFFICAFNQISLNELPEKNPYYYDNIFIYSNQSDMYANPNLDLSCVDAAFYDNNYKINLSKIITKYQNEINPFCNFYCISSPTTNEQIDIKTTYRQSYISCNQVNENIIIHAKIMSELWNKSC